MTMSNRGYAYYDCCLAFAFMLLLISHAIITGFVRIYCILFLYSLALSSLHPLTF